MRHAHDRMNPHRSTRIPSLDSTSRIVRMAHATSPFSRGGGACSTSREGFTRRGPTTPGAPRQRIGQSPAERSVRHAHDCMNPHRSTRIPSLDSTSRIVRMAHATSPFSRGGGACSTSREGFTRRGPTTPGAPRQRTGQSPAARSVRHAHDRMNPYRSTRIPPLDSTSRIVRMAHATCPFSRCCGACSTRRGPTTPGAPRQRTGQSPAARSVRHAHDRMNPYRSTRIPPLDSTSRIVRMAHATCPFRWGAPN